VLRGDDHAPSALSTRLCRGNGAGHQRRQHARREAQKVFVDRERFAQRFAAILSLFSNAGFQAKMITKKYLTIKCNKRLTINYGGFYSSDN
jgi:hypothetical protein